MASKILAFGDFKNHRTPVRFSSTTGISYETKGSKNIGFETGYYLKKYVFTDLYLNITYSSIPIYLKFLSKNMNFSVGLNLDVLTNVNEFSVEFDDYDLHYFYPILVGVNAKMSKDFLIIEKIIIEPEASFNYNSNEISFIFGLGLKLKYKLR